MGGKCGARAGAGTWWEREDVGNMGARRKPTESDTLAGLTDAQALAVAALVGGSTDTEAAKAAGVTRQTVNTWRHTNPAFMAALAQARRAVWETSADRIRSLASRALDVVAEFLDEDADARLRLSAAQTVLKAGGLADLRPTEETDPDAVELAQRQEAYHRMLARITVG